MAHMKMTQTIYFRNLRRFFGLFQLEKIIADMQSIYSKTKICAYNATDKCDLSLEPGTVTKYP